MATFHTLFSLTPPQPARHSDDDIMAELRRQQGADEADRIVRIMDYGAANADAEYAYQDALDALDETARIEAEAVRDDEPIEFRSAAE